MLLADLYLESTYETSGPSRAFPAWLTTGLGVLSQGSSVTKAVRLRFCSRSIIAVSSGEGSSQSGTLGTGGVVGLRLLSIDVFGKLIIEKDVYWGG
jgi:hypothetical protein